MSSPRPRAEETPHRGGNDAIPPICNSRADNNSTANLSEEVGVTHTDQQDQSTEKQAQREIKYLYGWRFYTIAAAIGLTVCLVNMEVSIVSTSLVTIANDFQSFDQSNWIVIAYLSTYSGLMITWSKLSDIYRRKWTFNTAVLIFLFFSAGCGATKTMTQLIVCRAFQGIGASGMFSVSLVMFYELVPKPKYPLYSSLVSAITGISALGGPIIGGAIDSRSTWRWIFFLNVPAAALIFVAVMLVLPGEFPYHGCKNGDSSISPPNKVTLLRKVDFLGAFLLLAASLLFATALLEVSTTFSWSSAFTISLLVISAFLYIVFFSWERFLSLRGGKLQPVFPWQLVQNRIWMGVLGTSFLAGALPTSIVVIVPQRFQIVSLDSPFDAGLRLIAYTVSVPIGTIIANTIAGKTPTPPIAILYSGTVLQVLGLGLMLMFPSTGTLPPSAYVFEVITALGVGAMFGLLLLVNPYCIDQKYLAGALAQLRMVGTIVGLSIVTSVMNSHLTSQLSHLLSQAQLAAIQKSVSVVSTFPQDLQSTVETIFGQGFTLQVKVLLGLSALQILTVSLMWNTPQLVLQRK